MKRSFMSVVFISVKMWNAFTPGLCYLLDSNIFLVTFDWQAILREKSGIAKVEWEDETEAEWKNRVGQVYSILPLAINNKQNET